MKSKPFFTALYAALFLAFAFAPVILAATGARAEERTGGDSGVVVNETATEKTDESDRGEPPEAKPIEDEGTTRGLHRVSPDSSDDDDRPGGVAGARPEAETPPDGESAGAP